MLSSFILLQATFSPGDWIALAAVVVTILGGAGIVVFRTGYLVSTLNTIKDELKGVKHDVSYIPVLVERVNILWRAKVSVSNSPIMLNEVGIKILNTSRINEFTNKRYHEILGKVKIGNPENAYQAQELLIEILASYKDLEECKSDLEKAAFDSGSDIDTLLLVGAIDMRDKILKDLTLDIADIDRFDPKKQPKSQNEGQKTS